MWNKTRITGSKSAARRLVKIVVKFNKVCQGELRTGQLLWNKKEKEAGRGAGVSTRKSGEEIKGCRAQVEQRNWLSVEKRLSLRDHI